MTATSSEAELGELRALVRDLLEGSPSADDAWRRLESSGLTLVSVPESAGGSGGTLAEAAAVLTAVAEAGFSLPIPETAWQAGWLAGVVGRVASPGPAASAVTNQVEASTVPGGVRLQGLLASVPWSDRAEAAYVVLPRQSALAVVRLEPATTDVVRAGVGLQRGPIRFDQVIAETDWHQLADPDGVVSELELRLALARAVQVAGATRAVLAMTVRYAAERVQFGRPLGKNQVIQHYLARIANQSHAADVAARSAVAMHVEGRPGAAEASRAAKAVVSAAVEEVTSLAHQVLGAIGTTQEHDLHRHTMSLWSWRDDAGTEHEHALALTEGIGTWTDLWSHVVPAGEAR